MSVLALDSDARHLTLVRAHLAALEQRLETFLSFAALKEDALRWSVGRGASLILVDYELLPDRRLDLLDGLVRVTPGTPVVLMVPGPSMPIATRAGWMNVRETLPKPLCRATLEALLFPERAKSEALRATTLEEMEQNHIQLTLARCDGNVSLAAKQLGLERRSLQRKMQRLSIRRIPAE